MIDEKRVKNSINILCRHLNYLFNLDLTPNVFYLAKANENKEDVVAILWELLRKITKTPAASDSINQIKVFLYRQKCPYFPVYTLPEDMSHGSRDLLLTLSFLLMNNHLNDFILEYAANSVFDPKFLYKFESADEKLDFEIFRKNLKDEGHLDHIKKWIVGLTENYLRQTTDMSLQIEKMTRTINGRMLQLHPKTPPLSLYQIMCLDTDALAKGFFKKAEKTLRVLENHEKWLRSESIFWEWMTLVVQEKQKYNTGPNVEELDLFLSKMNQKSNDTCIE